VKKSIVAWLVAMALALAVAAHFWSVAFPIAAVPFPLTRSQEQIRLDDFIRSMSPSMDGYRSVVLFQESTECKNFIERQYGPARLAGAARDGITIWYWCGRWFKPSQHEEFGATADQAGNIAGYNHVIEEERALPTLDEAHARALAEDFLRRFITKHPFASLHFLETNTEQKPHRTDRTFTWEQNSLRLGDAPYHLSVTVHGNEIGSYSEYLKVPEHWTVLFQRQRSVNDLCYRVALFAALGIIIALFISFLSNVAHHQVRWFDVVPWGWFALFAAVAAAACVNSIPETLFSYPTTQQWRPFLFGAVFSSLRSVLGMLILVWVILLVADPIYRAAMPGKSSFRRALGPLALHDGQTLRAIGVGIAFAIFTLAYACVYYTFGQRIGVWCPIEIDFSKTMSGPMPWIDAIQTGLTAAFTEEMIFRAGAFLLLWRLIRVRWLALLLSAAAWGFLHSNYPQMPGYTRGIELTIVGVIWGVLMLRYGIVATLIAHYLYDCWMVGMISFQSASWVNKAGALAVSLWPVALLIWGVLQKRREIEPEPPHVFQRPVIPPPPPREWKHPPLPFGRRGIALVLAGCVLAIAAIALIPKPQDKIGALGKLDLSRDAILAKADAALRDHGYSPDGYQRVATEHASYAPAEYLLEHGTIGQLAGLFNKEWSDLNWTIRYFRFLQPEEFQIHLDQHGRFITWSHTLLRESPGAALSPPDALARARDALSRTGRIDVSRQQLILQGPIQQEHRRDWRFGFDQTDFHWGDAKLRTFINLQGAEVVNLFRYVKVPDAWLLEHAKSGWKQFVSGEFKYWTGFIEEVVIFVFLILAIRKHLAPWRKAFLYALFPLGIKLADQFNQTLQFYASYTTTTPRANFLISQIGSIAQSLVLAYLGAVFQIAVALGLLHWAWGWTPRQLVLWPADRRERALFWRDTLLVVFAGIVVFRLAGFVSDEVLGHFWPAEVASFGYWSVQEWIPWLAALTEALQAGYGQIIHIAIAAAILRLIWGRHPRLAWILLFLLPLLYLGTPETLGGFLWGVVNTEVTRLLMAWFVLKIWRFNIVALFLTYFLSSLYDSILLFLQKGGPVYQWQAAPLLFLVAASLLLACWRHARPSLEAAT